MRGFAGDAQRGLLYGSLIACVVSMAPGKPASSPRTVEAAPSFEQSEFRWQVERWRGDEQRAATRAFLEGRGLSTRLIVFTADWCEPCVRELKPALEQLPASSPGWRVGGLCTDHIQIVDCTQRHPMMDALGIEALPQIVRVVDGHEESRVVGLFGERGWSANELAKRLARYRNGTWTPPAPVVEADPPGVVARL